jgi:hypothetical protein
MAEPEVIYKTKLPVEKLPYYRLTIFMDEMMDEPALVSWYDWLSKKGVPCCIAMGTGPSCYGKLAVWAMGEEHHELDSMCNVETMGRKVMATINWPEEI